MNCKIRAWVIGSDGTEVFVAFSEEQVKNFYTSLVGAEEASRDFSEGFYEISQDQMDVERKIGNGEGGIEDTTYRKLAEEGEIPGQIITFYW